MKDLNTPKFSDPHLTAKGEERARVRLGDPQTLWFNTGTLCNIECPSCYILSSPTNDALVYLTRSEVEDFLDQLEDRAWGVREIAFTGGEPFLNPQMIGMAEAALLRGYDVLILTNAMRPMMRPAVQAGLTDLNARFPDKLTLRVSLDHYSAQRHDAERGPGSFARTLEGMDWLKARNIPMAVAGRIEWALSEVDARKGYGDMFSARGYDIDAADPAQCVLFPEMDESVDVPEITTACWDILGTSPDAVMCSSSRMVVKRKGADAPAVLACTLLPYEPQFELGRSLAEAEGAVSLNHPHCAKFCVLGGASCSA